MNKSDRRRYLKHLDAEIEAASMYSILAEYDCNEVRADIFKELAQSEIKHANHWAKLLDLDTSDLALKKYTPKLIYIRLVCKISGPDKILPWLAKIEAEEIGAYTNDPQGQDLIPEEKRHARVLSEISSSKRHYDLKLPDQNQFSSSGGLRAAVLGVNDGLVSNFSLVMGFAGGTAATGAPEYIIMAGLAGLIAGAFSMAAGEYVSMKSQRDVYEHQISSEREELEMWPEEEEEELVLIYRAKGIPENEARKIAANIIKKPEVALDTMAREELGLDPEALGSPVSAALSSFIAFSMGAVVPLIPLIFSLGTKSIILSALVSAFALIIVGGCLSIASGKNFISGSLRMLIAGS
ncbi:MAG: VIT1/CCC1 transporter family protein, partial [Dehalococcoidia bacterium]